MWSVGSPARGLVLLRAEATERDPFERAAMADVKPVRVARADSGAGRRLRATRRARRRA